MSFISTDIPQLTNSDVGGAGTDSGFADLTSEDFLQLLIVQLQNQDPSEPISNQEMIDQISAIRDIEANTALESTLEKLADSGGLSTATGYLGRVVAGSDPNGDPIAGIADRAFVADGVAYVEVLGIPIAIDDVLEVADPLTVAESYVGNFVRGRTAGGAEVAGIADRAGIEDGIAFVEVGTQRLSLREIDEVSATNS